jgi:hypothetical protein
MAMLVYFCNEKKVFKCYQAFKPVKVNIVINFISLFVTNKIINYND